MDQLGIESAHVVGASMGGMIAQTMAIDAPERVRSLVSMMSTTGNRWVGVAALAGAAGSCFADYPRSREAYIQAGQPHLRGDRLAGLPARSEAPAGSSPGGCGTAPTTRPECCARCMRSRPRATAPPACGGCGLPSAVIHGTADRLVRPAGGRATARRSPEPDCG